MSLSFPFQTFNFILSIPMTLLHCQLFRGRQKRTNCVSQKNPEIVYILYVLDFQESTSAQIGYVRTRTDFLTEERPLARMSACSRTSPRDFCWGGPVLLLTPNHSSALHRACCFSRGTLFGLDMALRKRIKTDIFVLCVATVSDRRLPS